MLSESEQPYSGNVFVFRGRRVDLLKILWFSGDGMNRFAKRLESGRFVWLEQSRAKRGEIARKIDPFSRPMLAYFETAKAIV